MSSDSQNDLLILIQAYAENLRDQAQILNELNGSLAAENRAEAAAYLAVANDLGRILDQELGMSGILILDDDNDTTWVA